MRKIKNILFKVGLTGEGIVNYDSPSQKHYFTNTELASKMIPNGSAGKGKSHDNVVYAKKRFFKKEDGTLDYKISLSSNFLRHTIFQEDVPYQTPNILHNTDLLYAFIASPMGILRGYMNASADKDGVKRTSPFLITNAIQTCNAQSSIEVFSNSGSKEKHKDDDTSAANLFYKEVVGNINYEAEGAINMNQLQFMSCDEVFGRYQFSLDKLPLYSKYLSVYFPSFTPKVGYYQMNNSVVKIPELGFKFTNEEMLVLIKTLLKKVFALECGRPSSGSYVKTSSLKIKLVSNPTTDTMENEDNWIELKNEDDIDNLDFDIADFYTLIDKTEALKQRGDIESAVTEKITKKNAKVNEEKEKKKAAKNKKEKVENE